MNPQTYSLSLEKLLESFFVEEVDMNKKALIHLLKVYDIDYSTLSVSAKEFIANNLFSPDERKRFYQRGNGHYFMETLKRRLI